jgi:hypothetical protein
MQSVWMYQNYVFTDLMQASFMCRRLGVRDVRAFWVVTSLKRIDIFNCVLWHLLLDSTKKKLKHPVQNIL